jgi:hypothetical protein
MPQCGQLSAALSLRPLQKKPLARCPNIPPILPGLRQRPLLSKLNPDCNRQLLAGSGLSVSRRLTQTGRDETGCAVTVPGTGCVGSTEFDFAPARAVAATGRDADRATVARILQIA